MSMFCYQCEQTVQNGCTVIGNCGKDSDVAALQDALLHVAVGTSAWAHRARQLGARDAAIDVAVVEALFTTVTNVNFDPQRLAVQVRELAGLRERARELYESACAAKGVAPERLHGDAVFEPAATLEALVHQGEALSITNRFTSIGKDLTGLQELLTYGVKGAAAYADHARVLGVEDEAVYAFFHEALAYLAKPDPTVDELFALAMKCGQVNLRTMELLDAANTGAYGHPEPTSVRVTPVKGKAILVSGHDLRDLHDLLEQTAGTGVQVYTHGEMLPAHGYPGLKKYPHLAGNYGGAWQDQREEFDAFPGAILMTTNCIQQPRDSYKDRIFTSGLVAWPGVRHIADRNFRPVIEAALAAPGFAADRHEQRITVGFGRQAVMNAAGKVIEAVKSGALKHFFLIGGCDGAKAGRNYFTDLAEAVPEDCAILTLACGKFRFNKLEFGDIGGIPRLLDVGQCNDAYSAIQIAVALGNAFGTDVNGLPLSLVLSWYEQKAVAVLLTLLSLGVKNIRLGPTLPAFVTPAVLNVLVEKFGIMKTTTVDADLAAMLAPKAAAA
jgi:hydroxylamine reductase